MIKKWFQKVTEDNEVLDLEPGVFTWSDPVKIAKSLKKSALKSEKQNDAPLESAMFMLDFYIKRAGGSLPAKQKKILEQVRAELRNLF